MNHLANLSDWIDKNTVKRVNMTLTPELELEGFDLFIGLSLDFSAETTWGTPRFIFGIVKWSDPSKIPAHRTEVFVIDRQLDDVVSDFEDKMRDRHPSLLSITYAAPI